VIAIEMNVELLAAVGPIGAVVAVALSTRHCSSP
jgi:hypothetical protein